jgi:hypothetical protein
MLARCSQMIAAATATSSQNISHRSGRSTRSTASGNTAAATMLPTLT